MFSWGWTLGRPAGLSSQLDQPSGAPDHQILVLLEQYSIFIGILLLFIGFIGTVQHFCTIVMESLSKTYVFLGLDVRQARRLVKPAGPAQWNPRPPNIGFIGTVQHFYWYFIGFYWFYWNSTAFLHDCNGKPKYNLCFPVLGR